MLRNEAFFLLRALRQEDPLEDGMATHTTNFAWGIPWTEKPVRLQSIVMQESDRKLK